MRLRPFSWPMRIENINGSNNGMGVSRIQSVSKSISYASSGSKTDDITISAVDQTKTLIIVKSPLINHNTADLVFSGGFFSANTNLRWYTYLSNTTVPAFTIYADVVEFLYPFKSLQTCFINNAQATVTINPVNTSKTTILPVNCVGSSLGFDVSYAITNSTTVTVSGYNMTASNDLTFMVVELY